MMTTVILSGQQLLKPGLK